MPCIWGQHNGSQLFLSVTIIPGDAPPLPEGAVYPGSQLFRALVDTGATTTGITGGVVTKLGLQPVGKSSIDGVSGRRHHNNYLFKVGFPFLVAPSLLPPGVPLLPGHQPLQLQILNQTILGFDFHKGTFDFDVLLGMDVISTGSLVVQGGGGIGTFSFSF